MSKSAGGGTEDGQAVPGLEEARAGSTAAAGVALRRVRASDALDRKAAEFLEEQTRLARLQMEHLHEQRALQVETLEHQIGHLKLKHFDERLSVGLKLLGIAAGAAFVLGLGSMVWRAASDHGLVVEAFSTPPDLAQKGLNGQVVASLLMDKVAWMDDRSESVRAGSSYKNSWGDDIKVEIPETGVSIGELDNWLRSAIGHQTHISGELFHTPTGLALGVRVEGQPGVIVSGSEADLDAMVTKAAETTYLDTQPYRFAKYLEYQGRIPESLVVVQRLATSDVSEQERAWAYAQISNLLGNMGQPAAAVQAGRRSTQLNPGLTLGHLNLGDALSYLGHDSEADAAYARAHDTLAASMRQMSRGAQLTLPNRIDLSRDAFRGDYTDLEAVALHRVSLPDFQDGRRIAAAIAPSARASRHDPSGARDLIARLGTPSDAVLVRFAPRLAAPLLPHYEMATAAEDWPAALAVMDETIAASQTELGAFGPVARERFLGPRRALALARLGRLDEATAQIAPTPLDCYLCLRVRAEVAALDGDRPGADRWFARAVAASPSLPLAETEWASALLVRGDADAALAKARAAAGKGPHFADPPEIAGEALLRRHDFTGAAAMFARAAPYAPRWGRLHLRWGEALMRAGRTGEARPQFLAARDLDLDAPDRARLKVWLAAARLPA